ncbi:MAG: ParB/RepB/Spo0J family partition protein [Candidatus Terrybacteria bacterium]|nr:ParB/RepB/Spo0J family partition protein [Candidatus Terrybacteria bacterium]
MNKPKRYERIFWIEIDKIKPNPMQPRQDFDDSRLHDLAESIRQYGVLQPLLVTRKEIETKRGTDVEYELISGERRLRASQIAGLIQVPIIIRDDTEDKIKLELAIIENLQREDLNPIERAKAFKKLSDEFKLRHHEIAEKIGKSREYVTNTVRLLLLPEEVQTALIKGEISEGHCRPILMLSERREEQMQLFQDIVNKKINVRMAEKISRTIAVERARKTEIDPEIKSLEQKLSDALATKVRIEKEGDKIYRLFLIG